MNRIMKQHRARERKNTYIFQPWPSWRWSPDGKQSAIFNSAEEVPEDWVTREELRNGKRKKGEEGKPLPYEGASNADLSLMLNAKKIDHNPKWARDKLIALLEGK